MKYTLCITQQCNLRCTYCYVDKSRARMSLATAEKIIDFLYRHTPPGEDIDIGFFGGEPLTEFKLIQAITERIENHPDHDPERVELTLVSNGTIYNDRIEDFLAEHDFGFGISCDGPPRVHDRYRLFVNGRGSSARVEQTIRRAARRFPDLMVNAVYRPDTVAYLPETVEYLASLGVVRIYLNPDFSAPWTAEDAAQLPEIYARLARIYVRAYETAAPLYISLLDGKIATILRGGYQARERCSMGRGELAFTASGAIFPCERLIGPGDDTVDQADGPGHAIGHIDSGIEPERMACHTAPLVNAACLSCGVRDHCMRTCGCSNYFSTGYYNRVGPLLCASERAVITAAFSALEAVEERAPGTFIHHASGQPAVNSLARSYSP